MQACFQRLEGGEGLGSTEFYSSSSVICGGEDVVLGISFGAVAFQGTSAGTLHPESKIT